MQIQESKRKSEAGSEGPRRPRKLVHAMLAGRAQLACNLEPPESNDAVSLVLWYKDKSMVPIYR